MEICRICLQHKKNLCSVLECEQGISFADMIKSVAKIKIIDGKHSVCLKCCRRLRSSYDFIKQVVRSDLEINRYLNVINFDNIDDVKGLLMKVTEDKEKTESQDIDSNTKNINTLMADSNSIIYRNVTITKVTPLNEHIDTPILSSLDRIKIKGEAKTMKDYNKVEQCDHSDDNYGDGLLETKKDRKKQRKVKEKVPATKISISRVCIKPIVVNYLIKLPTKMKQKNKSTTKRNKHTHNKQKDMCAHCGIMFANIKTHLLVHIGEKKYKCLECNKAYLTRGQLNYHQKKHFMTEIFKCDHCIAVFYNKTSLKSHMISHMDVKNHICPVCNKGFKRKSSWRRHKLIHISSAKSVKCEWCNKSFLSSQGLRHHIRVHTGERPFNCEICAQPYSYKHDFNRHCLKKHGVLLTRRSVHVMNEKLLMQERTLMKDLMLRVQGVIKEGEPLNPFSGPQAALAFQQALKHLGAESIPFIS